MLYLNFRQTYVTSFSTWNIKRRNFYYLDAPSFRVIRRSKQREPASIIETQTILNYEKKKRIIPRLR